MMMSCAVYGCANSAETTNDPTIQYYYFPKHPIMAQQWLAACWRADPIDLDNAQICSIHFDINSYSTEYKMLDYLGHYTRMLKYDAVPSLYLPNPHTPVIMKATLDQPITINTDDMTAHDMKDIMVYEEENVADHQGTSFESNMMKEYMQIEPLLTSIDVKVISQELPAINPVLQEEDNEKYKHITNRAQLEALKSENVTLRRSIVQLEECVRIMSRTMSDQLAAIRQNDEEIKEVMLQCDRLQRTTLSVTEQKNILSKVFSESQLKILMGKKKIYWSSDDMAVGYTIRHLSNKRFYMYLCKRLNIPLPALSSIKRWTTLKKNEFNKEKANDEKFEEGRSD